jgi:thiol-disulfide isomerase/thioredoxin
MKRIFLLLIVFLTAHGCSNNATFSIDASTNHEDGKKVFLIKVGPDNRPSAIDSTEVMEGKFSFKDSIIIPEMHYVYFQNERENLPVVLEPGSIKIQVYKDSMRTSKVTGTKSNEDFKKYMDETNAFYLEMNKIQVEIRNASINNDSLISLDLNQQFNKMRSKLTDYEFDFMKVNNDSYISSLILQRMMMQEEIDLQKAEELYNNFTEIIKKSSSSVNLKKGIDFMKESEKESPTIGFLAPNFSGPDLNGDIIDFDNINSKVIMIDFWASWCGPCRVENPFLVSLNAKYSTDEFQIVGVSLDRDKESWENAINDDGLKNWIHISHVKFWNEPIAKLYNITRMPTTFILNSDKKIIAMDSKGSDLEKIIIKQLSL